MLQLHCSYVMQRWGLESLFWDLRLACIDLRLDLLLNLKTCDLTWDLRLGDLQLAFSAHFSHMRKSVTVSINFSRDHPARG